MTSATGTEHVAVVMEVAAGVTAAAELPDAARAPAEAKLGDLGWADRWVRLEPERIVAFAGGTADG